MVFPTCGMDVSLPFPHHSSLQEAVEGNISFLPSWFAAGAVLCLLCHQNFSSEHQHFSIAFLGSSQRLHKTFGFALTTIMRLQTRCFYGYTIFWDKSAVSCSEDLGFLRKGEEQKSPQKLREVKDMPVVCIEVELRGRWEMGVMWS